MRSLKTFCCSNISFAAMLVAQVAAGVRHCVVHCVSGIVCGQKTAVVLQVLCFNVSCFSTVPHGCITPLTTILSSTSVSACVAWSDRLVRARVPCQTVPWGLAKHFAHGLGKSLIPIIPIPIIALSQTLSIISLWMARAASPRAPFVSLLLFLMLHALSAGALRTWSPGGAIAVNTRTNTQMAYTYPRKLAKTFTIEFWVRGQTVRENYATGLSVAHPSDDNLFSMVQPSPSYGWWRASSSAKGRTGEGGGGMVTALKVGAVTGQWVLGCACWGGLGWLEQEGSWRRVQAPAVEAARLSMNDLRK